MKRILNVVICYNNTETIGNYIDEVLKLENHENTLILIVDNSIINNKLLFEQLNSKLEIIYIYNSRNLGYYNGFKQGLLYFQKNYKEYYSEIEWIILSNTDIEFKNQEFVSILMNKEYKSEIGCIGPEMINYNETLMCNPFSVKPYSRLSLSYRSAIFRNRFIAIGYDMLSAVKSKLIKKSMNKSKYIYAVHGAFIILKKDVIKYLFEYNYNALLYAEEIFIAEVLRKKGIKTFYDTELKVKHNESPITSILNSKLRYRLKYQSLIAIRDELF